MSTISAPQIEALRADIRRMERHEQERAETVLPFGLPAIDEHLGGSGLALGALHEVTAGAHIKHDPAMILFTAGILARLPGPVLWVVRYRDLFAPGLAAAGLAENRVHYAEARDEKTVLLLMEEGLKHAGLAGVVGEVAHLPVVASRRLHLAARASGVTAFVLRRAQRFAKPRKQEPTASDTRWRISALPSSPLPVAGIGRARWLVELLRARDCEPRTWELEGSNETGHVAVPAGLGNRPAAEDRRLSA